MTHEWMEFVFENYLHFIIKMYKSIELKTIERKQIYIHAATGETCILRIFKDAPPVFIKDSVKRMQNLNFAQIKLNLTQSETETETETVFHRSRSCFLNWYHGTMWQ